MMSFEQHFYVPLPLKGAVKAMISLWASMQAALLTPQALVHQCLSVAYLTAY